MNNFFDINKIAKSTFPPNFIPAEGKPFSSYDTAKEGCDYSVVVKGFIEPDGSFHVQEVKHICN